MTLYYKTKLGELYHGSFEDILPKISLNNVSLCLTDPPYGLNSKMQGGTWGDKYKNSEMIKWDYALPQKVFDKLLSIGNVQIIWGANNYIVPPSRCWIIWLKPYLPTLSDFEMAWTNIDSPSKIFTENRVSLSGQHPTEKPVSLMAFCINKSRTEGITIDPFMGSGTTAIACEQLGRKWIGIEKELSYIKIAAKRIDRLQTLENRLPNENIKKQGMYPYL